MDESSPRTSAVLPFTQPAERRQARYFKAVLAEQRAQLRDELASQCSALAKLQGSNAKGATRKLTHTIGEKRRQEYELDCLIEALQRRFFSAAATPRKPARCFDVEITYQRGWWRIRVPDIDGITTVRQDDHAELEARVYIAVRVGTPVRDIAVRRL